MKTKLALAAAVAAVRDRDYMLAVRQENAFWRDQLSARLAEVHAAPTRAYVKVEYEAPAESDRF